MAYQLISDPRRSKDRYIAFATATERVARLAEAKRHNSLDTELRRLSFIPLLVVDEWATSRLTPKPPT